MKIGRDVYLNKLISKRHNGLIKVVTGMRRCGKSYLLFNLFKETCNYYTTKSLHRYPHYN